MAWYDAQGNQAARGIRGLANKGFITDDQLNEGRMHRKNWNGGSGTMSISNYMEGLGYSKDQNWRGGNAGGGNTPPGAAPPAPTGPPPPPAPTLGGQGAFRGSRDFQNVDSTYRNTASFGPQSVGDIQASPMYQWRMEQGNQNLDKRLAAMGAGGSGSEIRQAADLDSRITAEEGQRMDSLARYDAGRYDQSLQRRQGQTQFDAARYDQYGNRQWDQAADMRDFYADQNPMQYGFAGSQGMAGAYTGEGNSLANIYGGSYVGQLPGQYVPQPTYYPNPTPPVGYGQ